MKKYTKKSHTHIQHRKISSRVMFCGVLVYLASPVLAAVVQPDVKDSTATIAPVNKKRVVPQKKQKKTLDEQIKESNAFVESVAPDSDDKQSSKSYILKNKILQEKYKILQKIEKAKRKEISGDYLLEQKPRADALRLRQVKSFTGKKVLLNTAIDKHQLQLLELFQINSPTYIGGTKFERSEKLQRLDGKILALSKKNKDVNLDYKYIRFNEKLVNTDVVTDVLGRLNTAISKANKRLKKTDKNIKETKLLMEVEKDVDAFYER